MGTQSLFRKHVPKAQAVGEDKNFSKEIIVEKPKQKSLRKVINVMSAKKKILTIVTCVSHLVHINKRFCYFDFQSISNILFRHYFLYKLPIAINKKLTGGNNRGYQNLFNPGK